MGKKTGKDALAEIAQLVKKRNASLKEVAKAQKGLEKSQAKLQKAHDKFPTKERELYAEKLAKLA
jgi:hypothetical protein